MCNLSARKFEILIMWVALDRTKKKCNHEIKRIFGDYN